MVIDSKLKNFKDLVEHIVDKYPLGYLEVAHVQYYDDVTKTLLEVESDQLLMFMFRKYSKTKVVLMTIHIFIPLNHMRLSVTK